MAKNKDIPKGTAVAVFAAALLFAASFMFIAVQSDDVPQDAPLGAPAPLSYDDITVTGGSRVDTYRLMTVDTAVEGDVSLTGIVSGGVDIIIDAVAPGAFAGCDKITSIDLGDEIIAIGDNAFDGCASLSSVTFSPPAGLVIPILLGDDMFSGCSSLMTLVINAEDVTDDLLDWETLFGQARAAGPNELGIILSDNVKTVGADAFRDRTEITAVTVGASVESIGDNAFSGCSDLSLLRMPPSGSMGSDPVISIGENAVSKNVSIDYTYVGYTKNFFGWFDGPDYTVDNKVTFLQMNSEATTLYGLWALGYKVSFCEEDGTEVLAYDVPALFEFAIDSQGAFVKEGYVIAGWYCDHDGETYAEGDMFTMPNTDVEFRVIWETASPEQSDSILLAVAFFILMLALLIGFLLLAKTSKKG